MHIKRPLLTAITLAAAGAFAVSITQRGWPLRRFAVEGDSMLPAYEPGDRVLVYAWAYARSTPAIGDVVVLRDPEMPDRWLVKRVAAATDINGRVTVLGDNPGSSRDSRVFGPVDATAIVGRVIWSSGDGSRYTTVVP